jgi:hypothetical protein
VEEEGAKSSATEASFSTGMATAYSVAAASAWRRRVASGGEVVGMDKRSGGGYGGDKFWCSGCLAMVEGGSGRPQAGEAGVGMDKVGVGWGMTLG